MRKPLSKKLRFSIFARDNFACRYCGRTSDEVLLHVDHLKPVCDGGENDPENLLTSCQDCNLGKGGQSVAESIPSEHLKLALAQELKEQQEMLCSAVLAKDIRETIRQTVCDFYCDVTGAKSISRQTLSVYVSFVKEHGSEAVFEWFEIAHKNIGYTDDQSFCRYVSGIRRSVKEASNA